MYALGEGFSTPARRLTTLPTASAYVSAPGIPTDSGPPPPATSLYYPLRPKVDQLLAHCPTGPELSPISLDFSFRFDRSFFTTGMDWRCADGDNSSNPALALYNTLRVMRLIEFDTTIPVLGETNAYRWMRNTRAGIVFCSDGCAHCNRGENTVYIPSWIFSAALPSVWTTAAGPREPHGYDLLCIAGLLIHELWHCAKNVGHNRTATCSSSGKHVKDSRDLRGAWLAHYYYFRWLSLYSGRYMTPAQKQKASLMAQLAWDCICPA